MDEFKVFTGNSNLIFAKQVCEYLDIALGSAKVSRFSDGEIRRLKEGVFKWR